MKAVNDRPGGVREKAAQRRKRNRQLCKWKLISLHFGDPEKQQGRPMLWPLCQQLRRGNSKDQQTHCSLGIPSPFQQVTRVPYALFLEVSRTGQLSYCKISSMCFQWVDSRQLIASAACFMRSAFFFPKYFQESWKFTDTIKTRLLEREWTWAR